MAGSVMAVGMAAPAFADDMSAPVSVDNMSTMPTSINGGVDQALNEQPLQKVAGAAHADTLLDTVDTATDHLRGTQAGTLLTPATSAAQSALPATSALTGATQGALPAASDLTGATPVTSLLGGLPAGSLLGGLPLGSLLGGGLPLGG